MFQLTSSLVGALILFILRFSAVICFSVVIYLRVLHYVSANIGTTLLQALLEHWPKAQLEEVTGQISASCVCFFRSTESVV